jgi:hypothetical protein
MKLRIVTFLVSAVFGLSGCASQSANLTTTSGQTAATVDNAGTIAGGAAVTSSNTSASTTVSLISGTALQLSVPAIGSGTVPATFKNTIAVQLAQNETAYEQTIGNALQTVIPLISQGLSATAALNQVAVQWGLEPANPTQNTAFSNIESDLTKASSSATLLNTFVTGLQTTGVQPATTAN